MASANILNRRLPKVGKAVRSDIRTRVKALKEKGCVPGLAAVLVGDDPASAVYVKNKKKACDTGSYSCLYGYNSNVAIVFKSMRL